VGGGPYTSRQSDEGACVEMASSRDERTHKHTHIRTLVMQTSVRCAASADWCFAKRAVAVYTSCTSKNQTPQIREAGKSVGCADNRWSGGGLWAGANLVTRLGDECVRGVVSCDPCVGAHARRCARGVGVDRWCFVFVSFAVV
jgi:hypothetical protein